MRPIFIVCCSLCLLGCNHKADTTDDSFISAIESGGDTTNLTGNQSSFGFDTPAANLDESGLELHLQGDAEFERKFIRAVSTDFPDFDGVGPLFNNDSCLDCHARDGRGNYSLEAYISEDNEWFKLGVNESLLVRASVDTDQACIPTPDNLYCAPVAPPGFATQVFHRSVLSVRENSPFSGFTDIYVRFENVPVTYADGTDIILRKPEFEFRNPYDHPGEKPGDNVPAISALLRDDVRISPRMSLPVFGLGLLEAIPEERILSFADELDVNNDGISGRPNYVYDVVKHMRGDSDFRSLGRFGWKANAPSVMANGAAAYRDDMGITNYLFAEENAYGTPLYDSYLAKNPSDDGQQGQEVAEDVVKAVMFYANTLAVPGRRNVDSQQTLLGAALFKEYECSLCHVPSHKTGPHQGVWGPSGTLPIPYVENQTIYPYTDMLLHDMGDGLADNRPDFLASGVEWKTRPLWGIGLSKTVNPLAGFLHDARARTLEEAILWHGGEAENSKEYFRKASAEARAQIIAFLNSL